MRETKAHRNKMDRFHALVDLELRGTINAGEREELAGLQSYVGELTSSSAELIRKRIELQDKVIRESMDLVEQLKSKVPATKSAKIGGRP